MSPKDKDATTPRVYLLRHGATSWSQSGQYTGLTDLPLLPAGESAVRSTASHVFGPGLLIDPGNLARIYVSPRERARRTLQILFESAGSEGSLPANADAGAGEVGSGTVDVRVTEDMAEWGYGDYEGLLTGQIRELRASRGLDRERPWDIWVDGTEGEGSETPGMVMERVDRVIGEITALQGDYLRDVKDGKLEEGRRRDVLVVAHGHILRAFVRRWLECDMDVKMEMMLEPGGVAGLSYAHGRVEERAVLVGMSFPGRE